MIHLNTSGGIGISDSNLKEIYEGIEQTILSKSQNKTEAKNLLSNLNQKIALEDDQDYFRALVTAIFHGSGIKAVQLEPVLDGMFKDSVFAITERFWNLQKNSKSTVSTR